MAYGNVDAASVAPQLAPPSSPVVGGPASLQLAPLSAPNESSVDGPRLSVMGVLSGPRSTPPAGSLVEDEPRQPIVRRTPSKAAPRAGETAALRFVIHIFRSP